MGMKILFPADMLSPKKVDYSFGAEFAAASKAGFETEVANIDDDGKPDRKLPDKYLYRGWMMHPIAYEEFSKKVDLFTDHTAYLSCHWLPQWEPFVYGHTPPTIWSENVKLDDNVLKGVLREYGEYGLIIKGFVKSLKHRWDKAMYVPAGASMDELRAVLKEYQADSDETPGVAFRRYMPIAEVDGVKQEFRLFYLNHELMVSGPYWEGHDTKVVCPQEVLDIVTGVVKAIRSPFFTVDVAMLADGGWTIIEVGDGGVSGLQQTHPDAFYGELKERL
jgi:hypothetical protein